MDKITNQHKLRQIIKKLNKFDGILARTKYMDNF